MSNSNWPDNIPPQGMLCTGYVLLHKIVAKADEESYPGGRCVVSDTGAIQFVSNLTPITPQEWWDFAPWNYDMDSAPKDGTEMFLKDDKGHIEKCLFYGDWCYGHDYIDFHNPIAWLPLPEQK